VYSLRGHFYLGDRGHYYFALTNLIQIIDFIIYINYSGLFRQQKRYGE
jgi:hypothetical protein